MFSLLVLKCALISSDVSRLGQMPVLATRSATLCCFVAPFEGHVDLIHVEPRSLFIFDPMLCQLDRAPCTCRGSAVTFIWLGPFSGVPNVPTLKS